MVEIPAGLSPAEINEFKAKARAESDAAFDVAFKMQFGEHPSKIRRNVEPLSVERGGSRRITDKPHEKYGFMNQRPVNIDAIMYEFAQKLNDADTHCISGTWTNNYGIKNETDINKFVTAMNSYFNQRSLMFHAKRNPINQREETYNCWSITVVRTEPPLMRG